MITIPLSKGLVTVVDDDAPAYVLEAHWYAKESGHDGRFYAVSKSFGRKGVRLHRMLVKASEGQLVDHINGDSLDNRMSNLRSCTAVQNCWNQRRSKVSKTGYKGVKRVARISGCKYTARIKAEGRDIHLGTFDTSESAAAAYDAAALRYFGDFAHLNLGSQQGPMSAAA